MAESRSIRVAVPDDLPDDDADVIAVLSGVLVARGPSRDPDDPVALRLALT
jgi:hypothetical protein